MVRIQEKIQGYLDYCEFRKELDRKTLKAYRIDLKQYFEYVKGDEPQKDEIEDYITNLHKEYKQKTVKRKIASLKAFYNYLEEEGYIQGNPLRRIKVKLKETTILPRIIPREEIEQLLNYILNPVQPVAFTKQPGNLPDVTSLSNALKQLSRSVSGLQTRVRLPSACCLPASKNDSIVSLFR